MSNDGVNEDINPLFQIILSSNVVAEIRRCIRLSIVERSGLGCPSLIEVGGAMMGECVGENALLVTHVSMTMGTRSGFYFSPDEHRSEIEEFLTKFPDRARFGQIGCWHSHPSGKPTPSLCDLQSLKRIMVDPAFDRSFIVMLIVCLDEHERLKTEGVMLTRESLSHCPEPFSVEVVVEKVSE